MKREREREREKLNNLRESVYKIQQLLIDHERVRERVIQEKNDIIEERERIENIKKEIEQKEKKNENEFYNRECKLKDLLQSIEREREILITYKEEIEREREKYERDKDEVCINKEKMHKELSQLQLQLEVRQRELKQLVEEVLRARVMWSEAENKKEEAERERERISEKERETNIERERNLMLYSRQQYEREGDIWRGEKVRERERNDPLKQLQFKLQHELQLEGVEKACHTHPPLSLSLSRVPIHPLSPSHHLPHPLSHSLPNPLSHSLPKSPSYPHTTEEKLKDEYKERERERENDSYKNVPPPPSLSHTSHPSHPMSLSLSPSSDSLRPSHESNTPIKLEQTIHCSQNLEREREKGLEKGKDVERERERESERSIKAYESHDSYKSRNVTINNFNQDVDMISHHSTQCLNADNTNLKWTVEGESKLQVQKEGVQTSTSIFNLHDEIKRLKLQSDYVLESSSS